MNTLAQTQKRKQQLRGTHMRLPLKSCHFTDNLLSQQIYCTLTIRTAPKAACSRAHWRRDSSNQSQFINVHSTILDCNQSLETWFIVYYKSFIFCIHLPLILFHYSLLLVLVVTASFLNIQSNESL